MPEDIQISDLGKFNRKTYENNNVNGVSSQQLLELVSYPYNFEEILGIPKMDKKDKQPSDSGENR